MHAGSGRLSGGEATKRQSRVSQLLRSTLASIIFDGYCIRSSPSTSPLPANTRLAINVIAADVSPDLRNARVTVSVISSPTVDAAAKREAFAWLAANAGPIRHACAQRLSHMKTVPELTFKMTDVGAAVDVMNLIDRIAAGDDIRDDVVYDRSLLGDEAEWDNYEDDDDDEFGEEEEEEGEEGDLSEEDERRLKDLLKF
ncbi:hypothetical protein TeGR_g13852 [Tetraparma gracilis]|uniref:Ribosome-binding factor A n=1 Tax=Tetraparma gracilis TaxID=2962635 RepID=A0ABQ6MXT3_9STRA|nr:hypothetical protein TeGR_g13852 [Tetraparma gracilis]